MERRLDENKIYYRIDSVLWNITAPARIYVGRHVSKMDSNHGRVADNDQTSPSTLKYSLQSFLFRKKTTDENGSFAWTNVMAAHFG